MRTSRIKLWVIVGVILSLLACSNKNKDEVSLYITRLRFGNPSIREDAAHALGGIAMGDSTDRRLLRPLVAALRDPSPGVRGSTAWALGHVGDARAVKPLIRRLRDRDPDVRHWAAWALGEIGDPRAVKPLEKRVYTDTNWNARSQARDALGKIKDSSSVNALVRIFAKEDEFVGKLSAGCTLGEIGPLATDALLEILHEEDKDETRSIAAKALGITKDPRAVQPLIQLFDDWGYWTVKEAIHSLGVIGDPRAVEPLLSFLDEKGYYKSEIAQALGNIGDSHATPHLVKLLGDEDPYARIAAAQALGRINDPSAVGPLIAALKDTDRSVRSNAADALGEIGDERALGPLTEIMEADPEEYVRHSAEWAIGKIKGEVEQIWPEDSE